LEQVTRSNFDIYGSILLVQTSLDGAKLFLSSHIIHLYVHFGQRVLYCFMFCVWIFEHSSLL